MAVNLLRNFIQEATITTEDLKGRIHDAWLKTTVDCASLLETIDFHQIAIDLERVYGCQSTICPRNAIVARMIEHWGLPLMDFKAAKIDDLAPALEQYRCCRHRDPDWKIYVIAENGEYEVHRASIHTDRDEIVRIGRQISQDRPFFAESAMGDLICSDESGHLNRCRLDSKGGE